VIVYATEEGIALSEADRVGDTSKFYGGEAIRQRVAAINAIYREKGYAAVLATPEELFHSADTVVTGRALRELEAIDPWPSVRVRWKHAHGEDERVFRLRRRYRTAAFGTSTAEAEQFAHVVDQLFDWVEGHAWGRHHVRRGWLDVPDVRWEPVDRFPAEGASGPGGGAFRTQAAPSEQVIARRPPATGLDGMLLWLAASGRSWKETPAEIAVTAEHVYARTRAGSAFRIPRSALRTRMGDDDRDVAYVFGRRARLLLLGEDDCPVRRLLDAQLAAAAA
jgi:hypothetical protein